MNFYIKLNGLIYKVWVPIYFKALINQLIKQIKSNQIQIINY